MKHPPLVPAELASTSDGTPFSAAYGDVYHSAHGGLAQARQVFIQGNNLLPRWRGSDRFVIAETGFGLGLNFLATWQAWRDAGQPCRLHFVSVEKHPFRRDDLARSLAHELAGFAELETLASQLMRQWPPLVAGFHRLHFEDGRVTLTLLFGDAQAQLPRLAARLDALYLDGFAPAKNPALWSPAVLAALTRLCHSATTLATWSVAGELRRTLEKLGWALERRPGFGGKREMLVGCHAVAVSPAPSGRIPLRITFSHSENKALVIGAGLAGAAISERLANRGWQVELFERNAAPAQEASGNPSGVLLPLLAKDDAHAARLSRACYLYALRRLAALPAVRWSPCGVLHIAHDAAHEALQRATLDELGLPGGFASFLEHDAAEALVGHPLAHGGWWFPAGGWVDPVSLCAALLAAGGERIRAHYGVAVTRLQQTADGWQVFDGAGALRGSAPHIILANACAAEALLPDPVPLTLAPIRGQVSYLESIPGLSGPAANGNYPPLRHVLCRSGYLTPPESGIVCIGASFDSGDSALESRLADHQGNLRRLEELLPGAAQGIDARTLAGRVGIRATARDRVPLVGTLPAPMTAKEAAQARLSTLPRMAGLHALLGLGARGMIWAPLAAELLASQLAGEPLPVERELVNAIDPARFYLHALRRDKANRQAAHSQM